MDWRETGLKPLNDFRLKGVLIYSPCRLIWKSRKAGRQEGRQGLDLLGNFLIS